MSLDTTEISFSTTFDIAFSNIKRKPNQQTSQYTANNFFNRPLVACDWLKLFDFIHQSKAAAKIGCCLGALLCLKIWN